MKEKQGVMEWAFSLFWRVVALWMMAARDCSTCFSVESANSQVPVESRPISMAILLIKEGLLLIHNSLLLCPVNTSFNSIS